MPILTIFLNKATNLKDKDKIGKSDPYFKFELEQNSLIRDQEHGEMKSTTKENNLNPVYEETTQFKFNIPTLENMELTVKCMEDDLISDDKMGKCKIKLDKLGLLETPMDVKEKVYNRLFGKDAYVYLKPSYSE